MNPFLQRLAARSLEALPVLQPRRASRFEATEPSGGPEVIAETESSPAARTTAASVAFQEMALPAPKPASLEAAGPPPPRRDSDRTKPLIFSLPEPAQKTPASGDVVPRGHAPLLAAPESSILLQPVRVPGPAPESWKPLAEPIREVQPLLVESSRTLMLADLPQQQRPGGLAPTLPSSTEHREDIHISIGRIEIRAIPSKVAQEPRRIQEGAPSTLDTYLQQRGSRRTP